jgi:hypothetical protein
VCSVLCISRDLYARFSASLHLKGLVCSVLCISASQRTCVLGSLHLCISRRSLPPPLQMQRGIDRSTASAPVSESTTWVRLGCAVSTCARASPPMEPNELSLRSSLRSDVPSANALASATPPASITRVDDMRKSSIAVALDTICAMANAPSSPAPHARHSCRLSARRRRRGEWRELGTVRIDQAIGESREVSI